MLPNAKQRNWGCSSSLWACCFIYKVTEQGANITLIVSLDPLNLSKQALLFPFYTKEETEAFTN